MPTSKESKSGLTDRERQRIQRMRTKFEREYIGKSQKVESFTGRLGLTFGSRQHLEIIEHNKKPLRVVHHNVEPTYEHTMMLAL